MTAFNLTAPVARALRVLSGAGAVLVLAIAASGCVGGSPAPAPTPDPFTGLADRSDQAFRDGLEAYGQGRYREALTSFDQARLLSPSADPKIDAMLKRTRDALAPTATPVPPTATTVPVPPTSIPVAMSTQAPDTDLGRRYFGQVALAVVPTRDMEAPAATQFYYQDQIGLRIEGLKQHLRLPFSIRIFDLTTRAMLAEIQSVDDGTAANTGKALAATPGSLAAASTRPQTATPSSADPTAVTVGTQVALNDRKLTRFFDSYVWYHTGSEAPGSYRVELYASGVLTDSIDYTVSTTPVPTAEPTLAPTLEPTPVPTVEAPRAAVEAPAPYIPPAPAQPTAPPTQRPRPPATAVPPPPAPTATPEPTLAPSPTPLPTPATAAASVIGGSLAGLDVHADDDHLFIADGAGILWTADLNTGSSFNRPVNIGVQASDIASDQVTGNLFVAARKDKAVVVLDSAGQRLTSIALPGTPGDLQVDSSLGLVFVALPDRQSVGVIDARAGRLSRTIDGLPQITALAVDADRHTLYVSHLTGELSVIDIPTGRVTSQVALTGPGLQDLAAARGLVYAINTATHEMAVVEPRSAGVIIYPLDVEPSAIAASATSGSVYVLSTPANVVERFDPLSGDDLGRVLLNVSGAKPATNPVSSGATRSRITVDPTQERVLLTLADSGAFSMISASQFPAMDYDIPFVQLPESPLYADARP